MRYLLCFSVKPLLRYSADLPWTPIKNEIETSFQIRASRLSKWHLRFLWRIFLRLGSILACSEYICQLKSTILKNTPKIVLFCQHYLYLTFYKFKVRVFDFQPKMILLSTQNNKSLSFTRSWHFHCALQL